MSTKIMLEIPRNNELSLVLKDLAARSGMTFGGWAPMAWEPVVTYQYSRLTTACTVTEGGLDLDVQAQWPPVKKGRPLDNATCRSKRNSIFPQSMANSWMGLFSAE